MGAGCIIGALSSSLYTFYFSKKTATHSKKHARSPRHTIQYDQDLIDEQLARNIAFLGKDGVEKLRKLNVVIVGLGGVGSYVAVMLARSGVGNIKVIDFDQVTLSSLNRHAVAAIEDVGTPKTACVKQAINRICPWINVTAVNSMWTLKIEETDHLLSGADIVIDCIDNLDTKIDLLDYCVKNEIKVFASMGSATKADPTQIRIADISQTSEDPLSKIVRIRLKARGISTGIPVVFSAEKPGQGKAKLLDLSDSAVEEGQVGELAIAERFRVRILPVLGPLPGIFGMTIAAHLIAEFGGYGFVQDPVEGGYSLAGKARSRLYDNLLQSMAGQMARMKEELTRPHMTMAEVEFLIEEVYRGKTITGEGGSRRMVLTKWNKSGDWELNNVVPVSKEQGRLHEQEILMGDKSLSDLYSAECIDLVNKRMALSKWYQKFI